MTATPPPNRRRRATPESGSSGGRRRRRRTRVRKRQSRRLLLLTVFVALPIAVLVAAAIAGTAVYGASCDLSKLTPVGVGENSFVYAADGSVLGAIPAERNRTPVAAGKINPWMAKATVAIEDRRFYQHGGIDPIGIVRAVVADVRAGRIVEGGSTITQELVRNLYLTRERTLKRKLIEACLAIKLANHWSKQRILTAYMNEVYYGNHAYGIEAAAETYYSIPASKLNLVSGGDARGPAAGAVDLRPVPPAGGRARAPERGVARNARQRRDHVVAIREGGARQESAPARGAPLYAHPRAVLLQLRRGSAATGVRHEHRPLGRAEGVHDDQPGAAACGARGDHARAQSSDGSGVGDRLDRPAHRSDPRDGGGHAGSQGQPVQLRHERAATAWIDVQDGRADDGGRAGDEPVHDGLSVGAAPLSARSALQSERSRLRVERADLRAHVCRRRVRRGGDAAVGQHRVRADLARRRSAEHRGHGAAARRAQLAAGARSVDRARLDRRHSDRDGVRLLDARRGRRVLEADGDHEGRASERQDRHRRRLGTAAARARDPRLGGVDRDAGARAEHAVRHRNGRAPLRPHRRGQDGNDRQLRGRLVLRVHAAAGGDRLDRLSERRDPDARRARHRRVGPDVPRVDLASVHGDGRRQAARRAVPAAADRAGLGSVARAVSVQRLVRHDVDGHDHRHDVDADDADLHRRQVDPHAGASAASAGDHDRSAGDHDGAAPASTPTSTEPAPPTP